MGKELYIKFTIFIIILCIIGVVLGVIISRTATPDILTKSKQQSSIDPQEQAITSVVEEALSQSYHSDYARIPSGVRLLFVQIQSDRIILSFSKELLSHGKGLELEDALHQIFVNLGNELPNTVKDKNYTILIEGVPLEKYLE